MIKSYYWSRCQIKFPQKKKKKNFLNTKIRKSDLKGLDFFPFTTPSQEAIDVSNAASDAAGIGEICWSCCNIFNKFVFAHFTNLLQAVADSYFAVPVYTLRPYSSNSCNSFNKFLSSCKNCKPLSASFTQKKKKIPGKMRL